MAASSSERSEQEPTQENAKNSYKIIIVGGGIAGISTALHLANQGETDFKILEARNRIGGRIISVPMGETMVDLGASWVHGVLDNPIYELAVANGLINVTNNRRPHSVVATTEDGKRVPISVVEEVYNAYFWFCKRCEEYFLLHLHPPAHTGNSVGKHLEHDIKAYLQQYQGQDVEIRRMLFDHLLNRETCITGCNSMDDTGLSDFGSYNELPGGNISIPGGFYSVINCLAESLPRECIHLKSAVKKIKWKLKRKNDANQCQNENSDNNSSETQIEFNKVTIECEDGTTFHTNHVVVTLPLGILKQSASELFEPSLPDYKLECIGRLCFGVVDKIFLQYDRPFLNADISEVITLWRRTDECDMSKIWFRKIYSFSKYSDNILLAWVSGREAEYLETLTNEQVGETCTEILRKFLNDPYVPKPCRVVCTAWSSQPYTRGAYTSIGVNASQRDIELLQTPIYSDPYQKKPVLLFAGEATHSTFYSTTHGAYLSGKRAAEYLLEQEGDSASGGGTASDNSAAQGRVGDLSSWLKGIDLS